MQCWFSDSLLEFAHRRQVIHLEGHNKELFSWINVAISGILKIRRYSASAWVGAALFGGRPPDAQMCALSYGRFSFFQDRFHFPLILFRPLLALGLKPHHQYGLRIGRSQQSPAMFE